MKQLQFFWKGKKIGFFFKMHIFFWYTYIKRGEGGLRGIVANVMACCIVISRFELQFRYYVHFRSNTLRECINFLISPSMD